MSSLNASNESAGWFRKIGEKFNIRWVTAPSRMAVQLITILLGVFIIIWLWPWFLRSSGIDQLLANDGEILVSSPTIYTRQRLVNDRLERAVWLEDQLKAADRDANFRSIDLVHTSQQEHDFY